MTASLDLEDLRLIRERECRHLTGLCRTARFQLQRKGLFPRPVKIGERSTGYRASDIRRWLEERNAQPS